MTSSKLYLLTVCGILLTYLPQVIPAISGSFQGRASLAVGIGREAE